MLDMNNWLLRNLEDESEVVRNGVPVGFANAWWNIVVCIEDRGRNIRVRVFRGLCGVQTESRTHENRESYLPFIYSHDVSFFAVNAADDGWQGLDRQIQP